MLQIEVRINDRFVAFANVENLSALADISDYGIEARTEPNPLTGADAFMHPKIFVDDHPRRQSVWALVARVARELAKRENAAPTAAEVRKLAVDVIGADAAARAWLRRPAMALEQRRPLDALKTADGRRRVATLLRQIEGGVYI
jgi:hypothetical protein